MHMVCNVLGVLLDRASDDTVIQRREAVALFDSQCRWRLDG
jgi:hypothetical protein